PLVGKSWRTSICVGPWVKRSVTSGGPARLANPCGDASNGGTLGEKILKHAKGLTARGASSLRNHHAHGWHSVGIPRRKASNGMPSVGLPWSAGDVELHALGGMFRVLAFAPRQDHEGMHRRLDPRLSVEH